MASKFALFLSIVTLITGVVWLLDKLVLAPKRQKKAELLNMTKQDENYESAIAPSTGLEFLTSMFPIIACVLILRSFIYEPFQIPSESMMPTLLVGDFILVEKFSYGLKDPVFGKKIVNTGEPKRGDIIVFKYPKNPSIDYIKRLVGLPGDRVYYDAEKKVVCIAPKGTAQCTPVPQTEATESALFKDRRDRPMVDFTEQLGDVSHHILKSSSSYDRVSAYEGTQGGRYWEVPNGEYFMMGDNRDESADSRYWGFVPEANLVGKAVSIWISFEFERSPESMLPSWVPTGIRFSRIGGLK